MSSGSERAQGVGRATARACVAPCCRPLTTRTLAMMSRRAPDRFLTSVLMTDVVGSTEMAVELGDRGWRDLVQLHNSLVRAALRRHDGREMDTAGDGFFAIFDAPGSAIQCALEIVAAVQAIGVQVRAGVHVGEVEQLGRKVGGITVPIAARIASAAGPHEVLASATVRDLAAGADLEYEDRGVHQLKGVPGDWRLYAVTQPGGATTAAGSRGTNAAERRNAAVRRARARPIWQRHPRAAAATAAGVTVRHRRRRAAHVEPLAAAGPGGRVARHGRHHRSGAQ